MYNNVEPFQESMDLGSRSNCRILGSAASSATPVRTRRFNLRGRLPHHEFLSNCPRDLSYDGLWDRRWWLSANLEARSKHRPAAGLDHYQSGARTDRCALRELVP